MHFNGIFLCNRFALFSFSLPFPGKQEVGGSDEAVGGNHFLRKEHYVKAYKCAVLSNYKSLYVRLYYFLFVLAFSIFFSIFSSLLLSCAWIWAFLSFRHSIRLWQRLESFKVELRIACVGLTFGFLSIHSSLECFLIRWIFILGNQLRR